MGGNGVQKHAAFLCISLIILHQSNTELLFLLVLPGGSACGLAQHSNWALNVKNLTYRSVLVFSAPSHISALAANKHWQLITRNSVLFNNRAAAVRWGTTTAELSLSAAVEWELIITSTVYVLVFITVSNYYPEKWYFPPWVAIELCKKFLLFKFTIFPFYVFLSVFRSPRNLNLRLGKESKIGLMEGAQARKSQSAVASSLTHFLNLFFFFFWSRELWRSPKLEV